MRRLRSDGVNMRALLALALLTFSSCGGRLDIAGFEPYVATFEKAAAFAGKPQNVTNLVIKFGPVDSKDYAAECMGGTWPPEVHVDPTKWSWLNEDGKTALILHEMGHCILNRSHVQAPIVVNPAGEPYWSSIMHSPCPTPVMYQSYRDYYWKELFQ